MDTKNLKSLLKDYYFVYYLDIIEESAFKHHPFICKKGMRPYDRFFYIDKGNFSIKGDNNITLNAGPDQIIYIPYDVSYESDWVDNEQSHHYRINFILKNKNHEILSIFNEICVLDNISGNNYKKLFSDINDVWKRGAPGYQMKCQSMFMNLLYLFSLNSIDNYLNQKFSVISKGVLYLENNYLDDFNVDRLAEMCNVSPSWFRKIFFNYAGMSPVKYKNMLRIKKAAELLQGGEYNVTEAAAYINCYDLAYFNRLFRQVFGMSPQEYLNDIRQ